jgi:hypothetical protein
MCCKIVLLQFEQNMSLRTLINNQVEQPHVTSSPRLSIMPSVDLVPLTILHVLLLKIGYRRNFVPALDHSILSATTGPGTLYDFPTRERHCKLDPKTPARRRKQQSLESWNRLL